MIASSLKPSLNSMHRVTRLANAERLSVKQKNQNLIKSLLASICFLLGIAFLPQKTNNLASICQKHNAPVVCQVW